MNNCDKPFRILIMMFIILFIFTFYILGVNKKQRQHIKYYEKLIELYELKQQHKDNPIYFNPDNRITEI